MPICTPFHWETSLQSTARLLWQFAKRKLTVFHLSYEGDETTPSKPISAPAPANAPASEPVMPMGTSVLEKVEPSASIGAFNTNEPEPQIYGDNIYGTNNNNGDYKEQTDERPVLVTTEHGFTGTVGIKEDG